MLTPRSKFISIFNNCFLFALPCREAPVSFDLGFISHSKRRIYQRAYAKTVRKKNNWRLLSVGAGELKWLSWQMPVRLQMRGAALRNPTPGGRETVSLNQSYQAPFLHQLFPELCVHSRGNTGSLMRHARPANTLENPYEMGVLINLGFCPNRSDVNTHLWPGTNWIIAGGTRKILGLAIQLVFRKLLLHLIRGSIYILERYNV